MSSASVSPPAVSVVVPVYDGERYLAQTLRGVLAQTFQDFELIVVDDGSRDRSREVAASFAPRARLLEQRNGGVAAARNRGIREARGRYVCLLDQDDWWFPDKLERQIQALEERPECGVAYASFIPWRPDTMGAYPAPEAIDLAPWGEGIDEEFSGWIYHQFLLDCWMLTSSAMFRREVFERCGLFDEALPYSEDWELWLRVAREFPFVKLWRPGTLYRQHPEQGNRAVRPVDYRTALLARAARQWGLCSRDGRCVPRRQFERQLARYHAGYGLQQLGGGNRMRALHSFFRAWLLAPSVARYLAYAAASLMGWKPQW